MPLSDKRSLLPAAQAALAASGPFGQFAWLSALAGLGMAMLVWGLTADVFAVVVGLASFGLLATIALQVMRSDYPHRTLGACNAVTLLRLALACVLIAALVADIAEWVVFSIATIAFALDGVDGWLARRAGLTSAFGARFDMEVDAVLAMTLAVLVFQSGEAGAYVLMLGLPRYLFWAAQGALPWLSGDLPERFSRKVVCVVQIGVLLALMLPFVTSPLSGFLAGGAVVALLWSFAVDIRLLWMAGR